MNWEKEMISRLKKYNEQLGALENIPERIKYLEDSSTSLKSSLRDTTPVQGGGSKMEDSLVNMIMEKEMLKVNYKMCMQEVKEVNKALDILEEKEREIIQLFYLDRYKLNIERIKEKMNYEKSHIYRLRDRAIYRMTIFVYGRIES